uniref:Uncharacterized protein n=1 Tax=Ditylenchus dipsaci TaxID=166011 RepID=A0A915D4E0_9BILA
MVSISEKPAFAELCAIQTASAVAQILDLNVTVDNDLREPDAWYTSEGGCVPKYLTQEQIVQCKYPIVVDAIDSSAQQAIVKEEELKQMSLSHRKGYCNGFRLPVKGLF